MEANYVSSFGDELSFAETGDDGSRFFRERGYLALQHRPLPTFLNVPVRAELGLDIEWEPLIEGIDFFDLLSRLP